MHRGIAEESCSIFYICMYVCVCVCVCGKGKVQRRTGHEGLEGE